MKEYNDLSEKIIGSAIEVHKNLGPGLLESIYESVLCIEFNLNKISYKRQLEIPILYKNYKIGKHRLDLIVDNKIILELKAVDNINPIFEAQLLSYLKISGYKLGLLINFNERLLKDGIKRIIL